MFVMVEQNFQVLDKINCITKYVMFLAKVNNFLKSTE